MNIDTERLIHEVHMRPTLWNKSTELYKNRDARVGAWQEVCKELIPNYDDFEEEDRKLHDIKIQQRWRTARDAYNKAKNEKYQPYSAKKKKYLHYELLKFLDTPATLEGTPSHESDDASEYFDVAFENQNPQSDVKGQSKAIKIENDALHSLNEDQELELDPDDTVFFKSLQPTLKGFNNYQKLLFRSKVLNVAMEIEYQNNYHVPHINM